jgi:hypothetical protein
LKHLSAVLALALLVTAGCGSSKSNNNTPLGSTPASSSTPGQAQGVFSGTTSTGLSFQSIVIPSDKFYAIYGTTVGNVLYISGMITGQGSSKNGTYTATVTDFYYTGTTTAGSLTATYVAGQSINGTVTESGNTNVTFSGTAMLSTSFNYANPASQSDITGTWTGTLTDGSEAMVSIAEGGSFSGSSSGCSFTGSVTPDASGKNFFIVSLTYSGSPCVKPNQTQVGIGVEYLLSDGVTHQLLAGVASGTSYGTVFVANR